MADPDEKAVTQYSTWFEDTSSPFRQAEAARRPSGSSARDDSIRMLLLDLSITDLDPRTDRHPGPEIRPELAVIILGGPTRARRPSAWWGWEPGLPAPSPEAGNLRALLDKQFMRIMSASG